MRTPPRVGHALTRLVGLLKRDVALTRGEVDGLMAGLLTSENAPAGKTRLRDWLEDNADGLGRGYMSELSGTGGRRGCIWNTVKERMSEQRCLATRPLHSPERDHNSFLTLPRLLS